jgi:hypothetical protein
MISRGFVLSEDVGAGGMGCSGCRFCACILLSLCHDDVGVVVVVL